MQRKPETIRPSIDNFEFNPSHFHTLLTLGLPFVVLVDGQDVCTVINLAHVREVKIDAKGLWQIRFQADPENRWLLLDEVQSAMFAERINELHTAISASMKMQ